MLKLNVDEVVAEAVLLTNESDPFKVSPSSRQFENVAEIFVKSSETVIVPVPLLSQLAGSVRFAVFNDLFFCGILLNLFKSLGRSMLGTMLPPVERNAESKPEPDVADIASVTTSSLLSAVMVMGACAVKVGAATAVPPLLSLPPPHDAARRAIIAGVNNG